MSTKKETTLRLNMPQWQGGNVHDYYFGSELLAWLAPVANGPVETVPVPEPKPGETLEVENGILGRTALLRQARAARQAIEKHRGSWRDLGHTVCLPQEIGVSRPDARA
jgi:arginase